MSTVRLTMAQALVRYLRRQSVERDGKRQRFFGGCLGIFGHGNLAGIGEALQEHPDFPFRPFRNEQAMVHAAVAYARAKGRLGALACTSSIGPGATNMVTGAALATINRLPVLLLPGDIFARRSVAPVLQQLESDASQDVSVNDCFKPVSRFWDRITRPEQLVVALPEAMRVLTSPAQTGAVTLALPQDVQAEAFDYPAAFFAEKVWHVLRPRPDRAALARAAARLRESERPLIIAGGGVHHSDAVAALVDFASRTGMPVAETQAGKSAMRAAHALSVGGVGATGTRAANILARDADVVIGIGTRYSDFTTASKTAFTCPNVSFININVAELDAYKHAGIELIGDARATLEELAAALPDYRVAAGYRDRIASLRRDWDAEVQRLYEAGDGRLPSQAAVIGALNAALDDDDVIINAAGSAPGDLHKLWRSRAPATYHVEYGYSCMGYEIPAGIGVKLAAPERHVCVLVGDGSYLMMPSELVTAVQERLGLCVVIVDNHGFASIGALSRSLGSDGFGCALVQRGATGTLSGEALPIDYVASARSFGARAVRARSAAEVAAAYRESLQHDGPTVVVVETDPEAHVGSYDAWWDVPVAEVATLASVRAVRQSYAKERARERHYHLPSEPAPSPRIANAPCSWGVLEFFAAKGSYERVLEEMAAAGFGGTELGDWGFLPTEPTALRQALARRRLSLVGAFVPVALREASAHAPGVTMAVRTAKLLAAAAAREHADQGGAAARAAAPFIVLADDNGKVAVRTRHAGRIKPEMELTPAEWKTFAAGAERIARAVCEETGVATVFHHHCAGFVETPAEVERLLGMTRPDLLGLCLDTGHFAYGGGDPLAALTRWGDRIWHVHFKDCDAEVAARARREGWDYFQAVKAGVFCELGKGVVPFARIAAALRERRYGGWVVVEQDVLPGMGTPLESARRNRSYLRSLEL